LREEALKLAMTPCTLWPALALSHPTATTLPLALPMLTWPTPEFIDMSTNDDEE
jgi:hypothetical protein